MSNCPNERAGFWKLTGVAAIGVGVWSLVRWYRRPLSAISTDEGGLLKYALLAQYLPDAEFAGEVSVVIHAPVEAIFAALHRVTTEDMPIAKWLAELRYLPSKVLTKQEATAQPQSQPFLELVLSEGGNIILAEEPNREIVLGCIGKFHHPADQQMVRLDSPLDFLAFDQPEYQKLAMSFRVSPLDGGSAYRLALTHGTHALSPAARWRFGLYWLGIKPGGNLVSWLLLSAIKSLAERATSSSSVVVQA